MTYWKERKDGGVTKDGRTAYERDYAKRDARRYDEAESDDLKQRVICDYIAGMTDDYATKRYQQLFEPRVGSVFDRL